VLSISPTGISKAIENIRLIKLFELDEVWLSQISQFSVCKNLIHCSDYLRVVIVMSMGSAKKKPMTKKEREEKKKKTQRETLKEVVSIIVRYQFLASSSGSTKPISF